MEKNVAVNELTTNSTIRVSTIVFAHTAFQEIKLSNRENIHDSTPSIIGVRATTTIMKICIDEATATCECQIDD